MAAYWDNRTIKAKLFLGIGAILLVFAVSSGLVLSFVSTLAGSAERALNRITPLRTAALSTQYRLIEADDNSGYYVMDRNPAHWAAYQHSVEADIAAVRDALPQLQDGADSAHERQTLAAFSTWFDSYVKADEHSFSLKRAGRYDAAVKDFVTFDTSKGQGLIADFVSSTANRTSIATAEVQASSRAAVIASIAGALGAILAGAAIALLLGGSISRRLTLVSQAMDDVVREDFASLMVAMQRFAAGDLSARASTNRTRLAVRGRDETALLARSYNSLVDGITAFGAELSTTGDVLNAMIGDVKESVDAAANGNFDRRLDSADRQGVFAELTQNVNRLMNVCEVGLSEVARVLGALAHGDLTQTISADYRGTFGQLKDDSNATVGSLTRTVTEIKTAADVVSTSAREISAGNGDLSQRTEEQAASLEETAASMEELTATVNANAENAKQANVLAIGASDIAIKGGQVVGEVVQTMTAINDSGKKIVEIISVIDGIAFQTNILALNAAVEAARAGEQGRGFAVVAGEVRTLAQRSAAAAKEIKALIGDSVEKTTMGTRLVAVAGETMTEIVASVKRVNDIMSAIAAASVEQGAGIGQVNEAVAQMDKVTQQNAALVEQIAASAEALEERARGLVEVIGAFTLAPAAGIPARRQEPEVRVKTHSAAAPRSKAASAATAVATPPAADETDWSSF